MCVCVCVCVCIFAIFLFESKVFEKKFHSMQIFLDNMRSYSLIDFFIIKTWKIFRFLKPEDGLRQISTMVWTCPEDIIDEKIKIWNNLKWMIDLVMEHLTYDFHFETFEIKNYLFYCCLRANSSRMIFLGYLNNLQPTRPYANLFRAF